VDNIKIDLREIGLDGMDWIDLAQVRDQWMALMKTVMNIRVPLKIAGNVLNGCTTGSFSGRTQVRNQVSSQEPFTGRYQEKPDFCWLHPWLTLRP
jgi:hypothetical protein